MTIKKVCDEKNIIKVLKMFANTLRSLSQGDGFIKAMGKKIYDFGNLIVLCDEKNIYGFAGYYANDIILKKAYISILNTGGVDMAGIC